MSSRIVNLSSKSLWAVRFILWSRGNQKQKEKKHPVAAEGCSGTRGDTDALEQENYTVPAEIATAIPGMRRSSTRLK
jgi:hypothetical protein